MRFRLVVILEVFLVRFRSNVNKLKVTKQTEFLCAWNTLFSGFVTLMSKCFQTLTGETHERYLEKIAIIGGQDPHIIPDVEWSANPDMFPSLTYFDIVNYRVLWWSPFYSMTEFKN